MQKGDKVYIVSDARLSGYFPEDRKVIEEAQKRDIEGEIVRPLVDGEMLLVEWSPDKFKVYDSSNECIRIPIRADHLVPAEKKESVTCKFTIKQIGQTT